MRTGRPVQSEEGGGAGRRRPHGYHEGFLQAQDQGGNRYFQSDRDLHMYRVRQKFDSKVV